MEHLPLFSQLWLGYMPANHPCSPACPLLLNAIISSWTRFGLFLYPFPYRTRSYWRQLDLPVIYHVFCRAPPWHCLSCAPNWSIIGSLYFSSSLIRFCLSWVVSLSCAETAWTSCSVPALRHYSLSKACTKVCNFVLTFLSLSRIRSDLVWRTRIVLSAHCIIWVFTWRYAMQISTS